MSEAWFYSEDLSTETIVLEGREVKHASGARLLGESDVVTLFDGRGTIARGTITEIDRRESHVVIAVSEREQRPPLAPAMHLACALPKGDRQSVLLSMATQLGMATFTPLICERSIVKSSRTFQKRAERICLEACKQCRQPHYPSVQPETALATFFQNPRPSGSCVFLLHPGNESALALPGAPGREEFILVGPEGGLSEREVNSAREHGALLVSLGELVLRTETAAIAAMAWRRFSGRSGLP